ncbi:glycosyltransferase [Paracoccaceae bacterium]|nr:glycosyltransferase [Paracoccaceae bacterium]
MSICFINFNGTKKLIPSLSKLVATINQLDQRFQKKIELIVSDNRSYDIFDLTKILKPFNNVTLVSTTERGGVDINIMNCFQRSSGDYCWIFAVDDYVNSALHLKFLLETLEERKPDMLSFHIGLKPLPFMDQQEIEAANSTNQNLKYLINSGKISTCIYRCSGLKNDCINLAKSFCGMGYFHLSYGASLNKMGYRNHLFIKDYFVYTLHEKKNHRHDYHPKYSQNAHLAVANDYFIKEVPKLRFITKNHLLFQLKFIFEIYKNDRYLQWHEELLHDYVAEIGSTIRNTRGLILKIVYYLVLLKLFVSKDRINLYGSFMGLKEKKNGS